MKDNTIQRHHSEEFKDIVEKFPTNINRILFYFLVFIVVTLALLGWFIKSPDVIISEINVTAEKPPISLVCKATGNIILRKNISQKNVLKGEYIAVMENSSDDGDVKKLKDSLASFSIDSIPQFSNYTFALESNLGEIQNYYFEFLKSLYEINRFYSDNKYDMEFNSLDSQIEKVRHSIDKKQEVLKVKENSISISKNKKKEDSILVKKGALIRLDYENSNKAFYRDLEEKGLQENEIIKDRLNSLILADKKDKLLVEKEELLSNLKIKLLTDYQNLVSGIRHWEQKYVFIAPFDGTLEYMKFVSNNQFIKEGDVIFSVLPKENKFIGQALMSSEGAGKVKPKQNVVIKLNLFPYQEYGTIKGKVSSISMIPLEKKYLLNIELPEGLKSDSGILLNFSSEMDGTAEIITEDKRLITRIFQKIRHAFDRKDTVPSKKNEEKETKQNKRENE